MATTRRSSRLTATAGQDENKLGVNATTRVTRAKAAALDTQPVARQISQSALPKQANGGQVNSRKRAALGDVSNVHKDAGVGGKDGKQHAAKIVKTATSTNVSRSRPSRTINGSAVEEDPTQVKKASSTSTASGTRKRRAPLKPITIATAAQRTAKPRTKTSASSLIEETVDEEFSDGNKENEDPMFVDPAERTSSESQDAVATEHDKPEVAVQDWDDLDADEMDDPTMVAEYVNEIFDYMKELEIRTMPNPRYMDEQRDLQWKMRDILIDWLVEVHTKFRLLPETLFLAVNIVDRFLSLRVVTLDKLQLVGITGMFIAAKYEEVFSPSIQNFVYVADSGYTEEEILRAETFMLQVLDFNLSYPNPMNFLRRNSKADNYDIQTRTVAKYLMEIALLDHRFMKYYPSRVAATAMYLARVILERPEWDKNLIHYSGGYTEEMIEPVCNLMLDYLVKPVKHEAFFKKYASKRFLKASILARQWAKKRVEQVPLPSDLDVDSDEGEEQESKT
ncbi:cyclin-like protein [Lipomyces tetrasporus]|uniref:Cyclin-like protein n=1 Tax=Lipomyces tetrasporus TaxID=54092 RepID=A0AAD7VTK3_9ASCO|nr:cyclin-like protein [Lipomyces tetrasporus]KAJ8101558.1 cyclin-like protein [Lipomyces tetrasporus]